LSSVIRFVNCREREEIAYFLFLRSIPLFLGSFFVREDPDGMAYCIGERAGEGAGAGAGTADIGMVVGGARGGGGAEAGGAATGSGRDLGKMCFKRLFL